MYTNVKKSTLQNEPDFGTKNVEKMIIDAQKYYT